MKIKEIWDEISCNELSAHQVFTQMEQHIELHQRVAKERGATIKKLEAKIVEIVERHTLNP